MTRSLSAGLAGLLLPAVLAAPVPKDPPPKPQYDPTGAGGFVHFLPDGGIRVALLAHLPPGQEGYAVYVLDPLAGKKTLGPLSHDDEPCRVAFGPDGSRIATASDEGTARVWDAKTGETSAAMTHGVHVYSIAFSPDGTKVVTTGSDVATVWDTKTGRQLLSFARKTNPHQAGFSPDGKRILTTAGEHFAYVWEAETGEAVGRRLTHANNVYHAAFSPDGTKVVTASVDETACVWDAETGDKLATCWD